VRLGGCQQRGRQLAHAAQLVHAQGQPYALMLQYQMVAAGSAGVRTAVRQAGQPVGQIECGQALLFQRQAAGQLGRGLRQRAGTS
jgi:hypothetical protein